MSHSTPSYQLPNFVSFCQSFDLRTNPACHAVSVASESWLLALKTADHEHVLTSTERASLPSTKMGLLASVCFPACGAAQLRLLTDFLSLLIISDTRVRHARDVVPRSVWQEVEPLNSLDGVELLASHSLLQYVAPQLKRLITRAPPSWMVRFTNSARSFYAAQTEILSNRSTGSLPRVQRYIELRSASSGFDLLFDIFELSENLSFSTLHQDQLDKFHKLKRTACEIVALSIDALSYNTYRQRASDCNLIAALVVEKDLPIQGAMNAAGAMIQERFQTFLTTERSLLDPPSWQPPHANSSLPSSLLTYAAQLLPFFGASSTDAPAAGGAFQSTPPSEMKHRQCDRDLHSYVQGLRDAVVGTINWSYETELYFGDKGEEVRTFGWVFLNSEEDVQGRAHS